MHFRTSILFLILISFLQVLKAQDLKGVKEFYQNNEHTLLKEYFAFLSLPNTFNDRAQLEDNAAFILKMMQDAGIKSQLLYDKDKKCVPVVFGEVLQPKATKTILFYAHYDGQPVNPSNWSSGLEPFKPQLLSDRLDRGCLLYTSRCV